MKPDKIDEIQGYRRDVSSHRNQMRALERCIVEVSAEDSGIPEASVDRSLLLRFDTIYMGIKQLMFDGLEKEKHWVFTTPVLPIDMLDKDNKPYSLHLGLRISQFDDNIDIEAGWSFPDSSNGYKEVLYQRQRRSTLQLPAHLQEDPNHSNLNNLEWSYLTYRDTAEALDPESARQHRFNEYFIETLRETSSQ
jgi:hypothetical protein